MERSLNELHAQRDRDDRQPHQQNIVPNNTCHRTNRDFCTASPRLRDRRADGALMHDEQPMLVQPAPCEDQQLLPIAGAHQFQP